MPADVSLDASQRAVLDLPEGEHAVVFGVSGSGKTVTAIELVAHAREREGWHAADVLALAGTRQSARSLRDALGQRVSGISYGPLARSAPSLAFAVFAHAELAAGRSRPLLLTGAEQDRRLAEILAAHADRGTGPQWPEHLGPLVREQQGFRTELRDVIARARERGLSPEQLAGADRGDGVWTAAAACMQELDDILALEHRDRSVVDAAGLLHAAADALRADVAVLVPKLIVVDDAQELTLGAVELLSVLASRGCSIIALGDPDTATGMFRGTDPTLMAQLPSLIPGSWHRMVLERDWRQPADIASVRRRAAAHIGAALGATHRAAVSEERDSTVRVFEFESSSDEALAIARLLRERHVLDGIQWREMAVIVRSQGRANALARTLAQLEVPTQQQSPPSRNTEPVAIELMRALGMSCSRVTMDAANITAWLQSPLVGLDAVGVRRLRRLLRQAAFDADATVPATADTLLVDAWHSPAVFDEIDHRIARTARRAALSFAAARDDVADAQSAESVLWGLWERARVADSWRTIALGHGQDATWANRRLDAVVALFDRAARFAEQRPDATVDAFYDEWVETDVDADSIAARASTDAVLVGTPSSFVGREFDTVVVASVQDGAWPNLKPRGSLLGATQLAGNADDDDIATVLHDELRMFTCAVSRATSMLVVSAVANGEEMPSRFCALVGVAEEQIVSTASLTLRGLVAQLRARLTTNAADHEAAAGLALLAREGVPGAAPEQWAGLAAPTTSEPLGDGQLRVSPSQIETFSACALHWVTSKLARDVSGTPAQVGTMVHEAVEHAEPRTDAIMEYVDERWGAIEFPSEWEAQRERDIVRAMAERLEDYFSLIRGDGWAVERNDHERRFAVEVGAALLTGSIDWIERQGSNVRIVDLKTGAGQLSKQDVAEHPQLRAYQLAVERGAIGAGEVQNDGARLVFPKRDGSIVSNQEPLAQIELDDFARVVEETAHGMAAAVFEANPATHCLASRFPVACTIHAVAEVTE